MMERTRQETTDEVLEVSQKVIDQMTGIAVRKLGVTCSPDLLLYLTMRTNKKWVKSRQGEEALPRFFEETVCEYLAG